MLGNRENSNRTYLRIGFVTSEHRVVKKVSDAVNGERVYGRVFIVPEKGAQTVKDFDFVQGRLTSVAVRERVDETQKLTYVYVDFTLVDGEDTYVISTIKDSNLANGLINSLANVPSFVNNITKISAGVNNEYLNVFVEVNGQNAKWATPNLPKGKDVVFNGKTVKDYSERIHVVDGLLKKVQESLAEAVGASVDPEPHDIDYDPESNIEDLPA